MTETNKGEWLKQKLSQNGISMDDFAEQTGIDTQDLEQIAAGAPATRMQWDVILSTLNEYPILYYPAAEVITDLKNAVANGQGDARVNVYYGVNQSSLIFACYQDLATMEMHGADVDTQMLHVLDLSTEEALALFSAQQDAQNNADLK